MKPESSRRCFPESPHKNMQSKLWRHCSAGILPALLILFLASTVTAESPLLPPQLDHLREAGFTALYNMNYDLARSNFEEMMKVEPKHPAGYVYLAGTIWLEHLASLRRLQTQLYNRSNAFFRQSKDAVDPLVEKEFYDMIAKAKARAEARLPENKNDVVALHYLGTAHGAAAGY